MAPTRKILYFKAKLNLIRQIDPEKRQPVPTRGRENIRNFSIRFDKMSGPTVLKVLCKHQTERARIYGSGIVFAESIDLFTGDDAASGLKGHKAAHTLRRLPGPAASGGCRRQGPTCQLGKHGACCSVRLTGQLFGRFQNIIVNLKGGTHGNAP
jgi:hypothetical protein